MNPAYNGLVRKAKEGEAFCIECGSALLPPEMCAVCHGNNAMTTFCPNCENDCGCVQWS